MHEAGKRFLLALFFSFYLQWDYILKWQGPSLSLGVLCLGTTKLLFRRIFLRLLRLTNGTCTSNGLSTQVWPVALLCCLTDDSFVNPRCHSVSQRSFPQINSQCGAANFGPDLFPPQVTSFLLDAGRLWCFVFFVTKVTPPFLDGWTPIA